MDMLSLENVLTIERLALMIGPVSILITFALSIYLAFKMERIQQQQLLIDKLNHSLEEMDEQAKLIMRTDIELHKTQEELDRKITSLFALQKLSRAISTTLEESQVFARLDSSQLREMGFEKAFCILWEEDRRIPSVKLSIGFEENEAVLLEKYLLQEQQTFLGLLDKEKNFSSLRPEENTALLYEFKEVFQTHSFICSPVLPKEGSKGIFFAGTSHPESVMTEGDEELITILSNQLGQALENARLFEKTWRYQQELERKVEERTRDLTLALEEVKNISNRKTEFISAVSHELRTPLTSIKGYASLLLSDKLGELPEGVRLRLDKINRHSDELTHLVNDLLDIARIESGRVIMKTEPVDIKEVLAGVLDLLWVQFKEKQIALGLELADNLPSIMADKSQISRVFINIIGNALKFTPAQGKITVSSSLHESRSIRIDIRDTGCGIPPEDASKIFEEFYRVENQINEQVKGSGLGLSLVKHIIEAHRGNIWVTSAPGEGSTFSFVLPLPE